MILAGAGISPLHQSDSIENELAELGQQIGAFAQRHPDKRIIGMQYETTYVPWSIFNSEEGDDRLIDKLDDETTDIYIVADVCDLCDFLRRYPHYFEG